MRLTHTAIALSLVAVLGAGCATEQKTNTAVGAGAGAATGAVLGGVVGGSSKSTAVGAAVGAGLGAAAGYNWQLIKEKLGMATKGSAVQVSEQTDGSLKVNVPGSVSFASGSATITPALYPTMDKIAATLNEYPAAKITVVGYTDSVGSTESNNELSRRRADAVVDYLSQRGVQRSRMFVEGRGELNPIADNATEAGRSENRRVEMSIQS